MYAQELPKQAFIGRKVRTDDGVNVICSLDYLRRTIGNLSYSSHLAQVRIHCHYEETSCEGTERWQTTHIFSFAKARFAKHLYERIRQSNPKVSTMHVQLGGLIGYIEIDDYDNEDALVMYRSPETKEPLIKQLTLEWIEDDQSKSDMCFIKRDYLLLKRDVIKVSQSTKLARGGHEYKINFEQFNPDQNRQTKVTLCFNNKRQRDFNYYKLKRKPRADLYLLGMEGLKYYEHRYIDHLWERAGWISYHPEYIADLNTGYAKSDCSFHLTDECWNG